MFSSPHNFKRPLVWIGVFAHPDDETTSSAGTMMKWVKNSNDAYIITGTRGEEGTLGTGNLKINREDLGKVREEELRNNLDMYGVNPPYILDYKDQDLDKENPDILEEFVPKKMNDSSFIESISENELMLRDKETGLMMRLTRACGS